MSLRPVSNGPRGTFVGMLDPDEIAAWHVCLAVGVRVQGEGWGTWDLQAFMRVTDCGGCGWR